MENKSIEEIRKIVDEKFRQIDSMVEKKKKLLEELRESMIIETFMKEHNLKNKLNHHLVRFISSSTTGFQSKKYKVTCFKPKSIEVTLFLGEVMIERFLRKYEDNKMSMRKVSSHGRITDYDNERLDKILVVTVEEIKR